MKAALPKGIILTKLVPVKAESENWVSFKVLKDVN